MLFPLGFKYSDENPTARRAFTVMPGVHGASGTRVSARFTPSATVGGGGGNISLIPCAWNQGYINPSY